MPLRTKHTYATSRGTYNTRTRTFTGKGPAPAGMRKTRERSYEEVPTVTRSTGPHGTVTTTSGFPSPTAAKVAAARSKRAARRAHRIAALGTQRRRQVAALSRRPGRRLTPSTVISSRGPSPSSRPRLYSLADESGHPTAGNPTLAELERANRAGKLRINRKGFVTTPRVRQAAAELRKVQAAIRRHGPDLSKLSPAEREVAHLAQQAHRRYPDVPVPLAMAQVRQESGFNAGAVSSAGAQGLTQFIPSTAASYGVQYGTGKREKRSQVFGQFHLMHDEGVGTNPTLALNNYLGLHGQTTPSEYSSNILAGARDYRGLGRPAIPRALRGKLRQARAGAKAVGLKPPQGVQAKPEWMLVGGPKGVKHAVQVIGPKPLKKWLTPAGGSTGNWRNIADLNPVLARQLVKLAKATGEPIVVTSGYRSKADQENIDPGVFPKAPAGLSAHQFGMAADTEMSERQAQLAPKFGLEHGAAGPGVDDPPHTELTDMKLIREAMKYGPIRSGYAPSGWQSEGDLGSFTMPGNLGEAGGGYGGLPSSAVSAYAQATGQSAKSVRRALRNHKLSPLQILGKLKRIESQLGKGRERRESETHPVLQEMIEKYGTGKAVPTEAAERTARLKAAQAAAKG